LTRLQKTNGQSNKTDTKLHNKTKNKIKIGSITAGSENVHKLVVFILLLFESRVLKFWHIASTMENKIK